MSYRARPGTWFDAGTVVELLADYRPDLEAGLFSGLVDGRPDEEVCRFDEFDLVIDEVPA